MKKFSSTLNFLKLKSSLKSKPNILLYGPPGCGKTSAARILSEKLNINKYDIDDDHLEDVWKCKVSEKLSQVGDENFVTEEGSKIF